MPIFILLIPSSQTSAIARVLQWFFCFLLFCQAVARNLGFIQGFKKKDNEFHGRVMFEISESEKALRSLFASLLSFALSSSKIQFNIQLFRHRLSHKSVKAMPIGIMGRKSLALHDGLRSTVIINKKREGINTFVCVVSL